FRTVSKMSSMVQNLSNTGISSRGSNHEGSDCWPRVTTIDTKTLKLTRMVSQLAAEIFRSDIRIRNTTNRPSHVIPGQGLGSDHRQSLSETCANQAPFLADDDSP